MRYVFAVLSCCLLLVIPLSGAAQAPPEHRALSKHYVQPILRIADEVIAGSQGGLRFTQTQYVALEYVWRTAEPYVRWVTVERSVTGTERIFSGRTACFRHDRALLIDKIAAVRTHLQTAFAEHRLIDLMRLALLITYLEERVRRLDGSVFEPERVDEQFSNGQICPFHLAYWPGTPNGYGCTASVLSKLQSPYPDVQAEAAALVSLEGSLDAFRQRLEITQEEGEEEPKQPFSCTDPATLPPEVLAVSPRGVFSVERDYARWMRELAALLREIGQKRSLLLDAPEGPFETDYYRFMGTETTEQSERHAGIIMQSTASTTEIDERREPLRKAVREFAQLAPLHRFNNTYIFYLLRSCPYRPCAKRLRTAWKLNATDACFPYADGSYLQDESYEKCAEGAGVDE